MTTQIRVAVRDDAAGIARVHVDSWRTTYQGLMPDHVLDSLSYEQRETFWSETIGQHHEQETFVGELDGQVVGFACAGKERSQNPLYTGELYAIYVLQQAQKRGVGRQMVLRVARWLLEQEHTTMLVWVLEQNSARRFYEAMGGQMIDSKTISIGGVNLQEVAYGWSDLGAVVKTQANSR